MDKKIIVIGDVHGLRAWEAVVEKHPGCRYVFLGDYNDPYGHGISNEEVLDNFKRLIDFKTANQEDVVLLLGNHDVHYCTEEAVIGTRYNIELGVDLMMLYEEFNDCFQNAYQDGDLLFTHAGVTEEWFMNDFGASIREEAAWQLNHPDVLQNQYLHHCSHKRGGQYPYGGIFWADKTEFEHPLRGYVQIAGHNRVGDIETKRNPDSPDSVIMFCDCLQHGKYLVIDFTRPAGKQFVCCSLADGTE